MVSSPTEICNLALGHLGERPITSLEENSKAARACSLFYTSTRDEVLRAHRWNFAQDRVVLSQLEETPAFGWQYQYELPADCLRVVEMNDSEVGDEVCSEYIIEGRRLLTNADTVRIVFMRKVDDVSQYDSLFVQAFAVKLAIYLSEMIRGTTRKTEELVQLYERITAPLARRIDANEGRRRKGLFSFNSLLLRARGGSGRLWSR